MKWIALLAFFQSAYGLLTAPFSFGYRSCSIKTQLHSTDRRTLFTNGAILGLSSLVLPLSPAFAEGKGKVVVVGGAGYVGAHVDQLLSAQGYKVVSVSRSSPSDQASKVQAILGVMLPIEYQSLDASTDDLSGVLQGASAVVSCVGIIPGGKNQLNGNGAVNVRIAQQTKAAGIDRFVYVSVASELASSPAKFLLKDYFQGKAQAESAVQSNFGPTQSLLVKPAIIAGGPPGELRPPGPPGMTAVPVQAVAKAVAAGATGALSGSIDGNAAISAL